MAKRYWKFSAGHFTPYARRQGSPIPAFSVKREVFSFSRPVKTVIRYLLFVVRPLASDSRIEKSHFYQKRRSKDFIPEAIRE